MYKKIKATKNNSLKKASVLASVAVLASGVILSNPENFGLTEISSASAAFRGFGRRGKFGRGRRGWYTRGRRSAYDNNVTLMSENQRENFELFQKNMSYISNLINNKLSPSGLEDAVDPNMTVFREEVGRAATQIFELLEETEAYKKIDLPDVDSNIGESVKSVVSCLTRLKKLQNTVFEYIVFGSGILDFDRIKNAEKLEKVQELAKELRCPSKLVKIMNIKGIVSNSSNLKLAKQIAEKALKFFFACKTFSDEDGRATDSWSSYSYYVKNNADSVNSAVRPFLSAMHTLLSINASINKIYKEFAARRTIRNMRQFLISFYCHGSGAAGAAVHKKSFFNSVTGRYEEGNPTQPYPDFAAMPLYLADAGTPGVVIEGGSSIATNRDEFTSHLVKALGEKTSPTDLLNNFFNYADAHSTPDKTGDLTVKYDLTKVLESAIGSNATKEQLNVLDDAVKQLLSDENIKDLVDMGMLTEAEKKGLEDSRELFNSGNDEYRYVSSAGTPLKTEVDATFEDQNKSQLPTILAMPAAIRGRGLMEVYIKDLNSSVYNMDSWDDTLRIWIDRSSFISGAGVAVKDIAEAYQRVRDLGKKISDIKSTKSKTKEERDAAVKESQITNVIALAADNRNIINFSIEINGKTLKLNGFPVTTKCVSCVLCPKTAADSKTGTANIDIPLVDVVNGTAPVDLSQYVNDIGNYELHVREAVLQDPAARTVSAYNFLHKYKFAFGMRGVKRLSGLETTIEQADNSILDYSTTKAYINEDGSFTFRIKLKKDAKSRPDILTGVYFKKDAPANMETDKFALQRTEDDWYEFTTNKKQEGSMQLHVYRGEVEADKYDGKIEVEKGKTSPLETNGVDTALSDALAKGDYSSRKSSDSIATTKKDIKISISDDSFDDSTEDDESNHRVNYSIVDNSGNKILSGTTDAEFVKRKEDSYGSRDAVIYKLGVDVPSAAGEYRLRIEDFADGTLETSSSINKATQPNTIIDTKLISDRD